MKYIPAFLLALALCMAAAGGYSYRALSHPDLEYQIKCEPDSIFMYDGKRLVWSGEYDSLDIGKVIELDNQ